MMVSYFFIGGNSVTKDQKDQENKAGKSLGSGMAIGIAIGVGIGMATDNLPLWIAIGVAIGVSLGGAGYAFRNNKEEKE
jgi:hypothetical protein